MYSKQNRRADPGQEPGYLWLHSDSAICSLNDLYYSFRLNHIKLVIFGLLNLQNDNNIWFNLTFNHLVSSVSSSVLVY